MSILDVITLPLFGAAVVLLCKDGFYRSWLAEIRIVVFFRLERQVKGESVSQSVSQSVTG